MEMTRLNGNSVFRVAVTNLSAYIVLAGFPEDVREHWPQWGGPNRDFTVETTGIADRWPENGPKRLWHRELGKGYSSIVADGGVLYTMYRNPARLGAEFTIALDAATGDTLWEHGRPSPWREDDWDYRGPNATPLVCDDSLYTVGFNAVLRCFDKKDGRVRWKHDLPREFGGEVPRWGYSWSPIAYGETVIMSAGQPEGSKRGGGSLLAFDKSSGSLVWKSQTFRMGHASPILITFDDRKQLVLYTMDGVMGVDPANGQRLWEWSCPREGPGHVVTTPVWNGKDTLFITSAGEHHKLGTALKLAQQDDQIVSEVLWGSTKNGVYGVAPIRIGNHLYGSNDRALMCFDFHTGERKWYERDFPRAKCVRADGKFIILDENGWLTLATASPERLTIHSRCNVTERWSLTPPTLVGTTLYIRDERHIMALDVGSPASGS